MHVPHRCQLVKFTTLLLALIVAVFMMAGCGNTASSPSSNSQGTSPGTSSNPGSTPGTGTGSGGSSSGSGGTGSGSSGGASSSAAQAKFLYTPNDNGIDVVAIDSAGSLTKVGTVLLETPGASIAMAADPMGRFFYAMSISAAVHGNASKSNGISEYTINSGSGNLTPVQGAPVLFADNDRNLTQIVIDASGKFAYITDNDSAAGRNGIFSYSIDQSSGLLSPVSGSPFGTSAGTLLAVSPDGKFLFNAGNELVSYTLNNGQPTLAGTAPVSGSAGPNGFQPSDQILCRSDSAFVYLLDQFSSEVEVYAIGANGTLTTVAGSPFKVGISGSAMQMALTPDGRFLYVYNFDNSANTGSSLSGYAVNTSTGAVGAALPGSPFVSNDNNAATFVTADFSGKFLFANTAAGLATYNIGAEGSLTRTAISTAPFVQGNLVLAQ